MMITVLLETCRGRLYNVIVHQVGHLPRVVTARSAKLKKDPKFVNVRFVVMEVTVGQVYVGVPLSSRAYTIPPMIVALTRRTNGRSLGIF